MSRARRAAAALALAAGATLLLGAVPPRPGGLARLFVPGEPWDPVPSTLATPGDLLLSQAVFEGLTRPAAGGGVLPGAARSWEVGPDPLGAGAERWTFRLDPLARFPDGRRVTPEDVIRSWERLLRSPISPNKFLLEPVLGAREFAAGEAGEISGLAVDAEALQIVLSRPAPDLPVRLAHPALAVAADDGGTGPFAFDAGDGSLQANRYHSRGRPYLDGFRLVEPGEVDPQLLLEAGEADAAMLFGRDAGSALDRASGDARLLRTPGWDRTYALALNPNSGFFQRQANFRTLLARAVNRQEMLRLLFDGRGRVVDSLLPDGPTPGPPVTVPSLPGTRSRMVITCNRSDPLAMSIAARVKAAWEEINLIIDLEAVDPAQLRLRLRLSEYDVAVLLHHPASQDPVLALRETLARHEGAYVDAIRALGAASASADPQERLASARVAEALVTGDFRLAPLVRLHAWMLVDRRLAGVDAGPASLLRLDDAFFLP